MLRPTNGIANRRRLIRTGCPDQRVRDFLEKRRRNAADLLHDFGRVAREMSFQDLKNTAGMLQSQVTFREAEPICSLVEPGFIAVSPFVRLPTGKETGS